MVEGAVLHHHDHDVLDAGVVRRRELDGAAAAGHQRAAPVVAATPEAEAAPSRFLREIVTDGLCALAAPAKPARRGCSPDVQDPVVRRR